MERKNMTRRELLQASAAAGAIAAIPFSLGVGGASERGRGQSSNGQKASAVVAGPSPLKPPASGAIPVAFVISDGAVIIDFCGPWEVFQDAAVPAHTDGFQLYTVAEKIEPIKTSGGMLVMPNYTFQNAPAPKVVVIPAQNGAGEAAYRWIRESTKQTDVTMSVCTGAFVLAATGLLAGKSATTHHYAYRSLEAQYPDIHVKRGARFVEEGKLATAGGLTSGMDLALRVVERYYGREAAEKTALGMEYQGKGWMDSSGAANAEYAVTPQGGCPICGMDVEKDPELKSVYQGRTFYFCSKAHKDLFDANPAKFADAKPSMKM